MSKLADGKAKEICDNIRKSRDGPPESRAITSVVQQNLEWLTIFCRYKRNVQRPLCLDVCPIWDVEIVGRWYEQQGEDPPETMIPTYKDNLNKRQWFESNRTFLSTKRGKSGFPIECLIRPSEGTPLEDPGFMNPTIPEELFQRGHINIEGTPTNQKSKIFSGDNRELHRLH